MNTRRDKFYGYWVLCTLLFFVGDAYAAKMFVSWTPPTTNTDGSPLTDLTGYRVEWSTCNTDGSFGVFQAGVNVGAGVTRTAIYPTGLKLVCAHVFAINSKNQLSAASNTSSGAPPPTLGQPSKL